MDGDRTAMLFCPPLPPLRLDRSAKVAIGRHTSCELVVRRSDVSRRHAEVWFEGGRFVLGDLGSTNGSFLNGEAVAEPRALSPGDRIEIGSTTITFCEIQGELAEPAEEPDDSKTMIALHVPALDALQGDLSEVPPDALLQLLEMQGKTGVLEIRTEAGSARLWLSGGAPIHAECDRQQGFDAALAIAGITRGRFRFEPELVRREPTIRASVTELLLEAARQRDERSNPT